MSPTLLNLAQTLAKNAEEKDHVEFHGVRITPAFMEFKNSFEGRTYKQTMTLQNVGSTTATIRITQPTSFAYKIKCIRHQNLAPGLSIVKEVSYEHSHVNAPSCIIGIYINQCCYDYQLFANVIPTAITITPTSIDFGLVDTGVTSKGYIFTIRNDGAKATRYYIDCTRSRQQFAINPNRGFLPSKQSVQINVKLISTEEGDVSDPIYVKCEKPYIVHTRGKIIKPKLEPIDSGLSTTFSLLDFPVTYVGMTSTKTVYIRNYSSCGSMFSVMGQVKGNFLDFKTCLGLVEDFNQFDVSPKDGVCESKEVKVFQFKFTPQKPKPNDKAKSFYFCIYNICRIRCKYLSESLYDDEVFMDYDINSKQYSQTWSASINFDQNKDVDTGLLIADDGMDSFSEQVEARQECDCVSFYMHGIAEKPSVTIVPDELMIFDLEIGRRETRVLELKNCSDKLPIIIVYKKVAYVNVDKNNIFLEPMESIQIAIYVTPQRMGIVKSEICLDLVFYDQPRMSDQLKVIGKVVVPLTFEAGSVKSLPIPQINKGITPNYINEVGKFCEDIRFDTPMRKPRAAVIGSNDLKRASSALIAFPNDMQRSLRPWRDKPKIKTIFTRIPRYVAPLNSDYELTPLEKRLKANNDNYYMMYMRKAAAGLQVARRISAETVSEYDLTDQDMLMAKDAPSSKIRCDRPKEIVKQSYFIPLTPTEMNNIRISPMVIRTNKIAAHSSFEFKIKITNFNLMAIRIFVRPETTNIYFLDGNRRKIPGRSCVSMPFLFVSSSVGYYTTSLDIIVNECGVFVVTLIADICPVTLHLSTDLIEFTDENVYSFIEITNPLNINTKFSWQMQCKNFEILPSFGIVSAHRTLLCQILYLPAQEGPLGVEVDFFVNDKMLYQIKLIVKSDGTTLRFIQPELNCVNIPLNIPVTYSVMLENDSEVSKAFCLLDCKFLKYMQVVPHEGIVHGNSYMVINITITLVSCVMFNTLLKFHIVGSGIVELPLIGNVVYPDVQVTPNIIKFIKIPASTYDVVRFNIENRSKAIASVKFDMDMYNEYKITESRNHWESEAVNEVTLEKHSSKPLFIHFLPKAAVSDKFFLPMVVNNSLGPVLSDSLASRVSCYLKTDVPDSKRTSIPHTLPVTTVHSYATEPKLCFSKFMVYLDFKCPPFKCNSNYELKIFNSQKETDDFCIRTEELNECFSIRYLRGKSITEHRHSIVCSLSWKEEVVFDISFKPLEIGTFKSALPVYFRSDNSAQPHNTLYIEGTFESPTIICKNPISYYKPVPLHVNIATSRRLTFENHYSNCSVYCFSDFRDLRTEVIDSPPDSNNRRDVIIKLFFRIEKPRRLACNFTILCTCGAKYETIFFGIAENCFLSTYALVNTYIGNTSYNLELNRRESLDTLNRPSFMSILDAPVNLIEEFDLSNFFVSFPLFPSPSDDRDNEEFYEFMNVCVSVVEEWIYTQGFFGCSFYKIPDGISFVMDSSRPTKTKRIRPTKPPFIQLLFNLAGKQIQKYLEQKPIPADEHCRASYIYGLYEKALQFLCDMGAYFTYIAPEFMMDYQTYCIYTNNLPPETRAKAIIKIPNRDVFYNISKQCWLDVILQTYKVLMLSRLIVGQKGVLNVTKAKSTPEERFRSSVKNISKNNHLFNNTELLLLNWLEFHYNEVRTTLWAENAFLGSREMTFFGDSLSDGFAYAAITLTYCPYLESHFEDLFTAPLSYEEILHNNIKVVQAWNILNFSLGITVQDLTRPHSLRTLFTIVYLYQVLPSMYPSENLEFCVGLSERMKKTLIIRNSNDFPVAYKAIVYQNYEECFGTDRHFYVLQAKSKCTVVITYWAKFIKPSQCTLILSGECKGYNYAKSTVVSLVGTPDLSYVTETIEIPVSLYKVEEVTLNCRSPYMVKAVHSIQFSSLPCTSPDEVNALPLHRNYPKYYISRLFPVKAEIEFNDEGEGSVDCTMICLLEKNVPIWIYLRNVDVGDFVIQVQTKCRPFEEKERIDVLVPQSKGKNSSKKEVEVILEIPCQNRLLWRTIMRGFLKICTYDSAFWKNQICTLTGIHILQKTLELNSPVQLCGSIEYKLQATENVNIKLPDTVFVKEECSSDFVKVPMNLPGDTRKLPKYFCIDLKTVDNYGKRSYYINFIVDQSDPELSA